MACGVRLHFFFSQPTFSSYLWNEMKQMGRKVAQRERRRKESSTKKASAVWAGVRSCSAALHSLFLSLCWLRRFTRLASLALLAFRKEMEEKKKSCLISLAVGPKTFRSKRRQKVVFLSLHSHQFLQSHLFISSLNLIHSINFINFIHKWRRKRIKDELSLLSFFSRLLFGLVALALPAPITPQREPKKKANPTLPPPSARTAAQFFAGLFSWGAKPFHFNSFSISLLILKEKRNGMNEMNWAARA